MLAVLIAILIANACAMALLFIAVLVLSLCGHIQRYLILRSLVVLQWMLWAELLLLVTWIVVSRRTP
jgi:hypothetical protein